VIKRAERVREQWGGYMTDHESASCSALITALIAGGTLMPQLAYADSSASASSETTLEEIVVTAQKRVQSINDVGLTISAMGSDVLKRQGIKSLSDLAAQVPGLTFAPSDFGTPVFTLRGVGFYDNSIGGYPTTSVYVDEVPLPFPAYTTHANLEAGRTSLTHKRANSSRCSRNSHLVQTHQRSTRRSPPIRLPRAIRPLPTGRRITAPGPTSSSIKRLCAVTTLSLTLSS
jgi:hypothetical protein